MSMIRVVGNYSKTQGTPFRSFMASAQAGENASLQVVSDSTGASAYCWPRLLATWMGTQFPQHTVRYSIWNGTNQSYDKPTYVQDTGERYFQRNGAGYIYMLAAQIPTISGDLDISARLTLNSWRDDTGMPYILQKWTSVGNQRSFYLQVNVTGSLLYYWSTDGVTTQNVSSGPEGIVPNDGTIKGVRVVHDIDNGAGGNTVTFYTTTDGFTWVQLGVPKVTAGTTSIYSSTADLNVLVSGATTIGNLYDVSLSIAGLPVFSRTLNGFQKTAQILTYGNPVIDIFNASYSGANLSYWTDSTRVTKSLLPSGQNTAILALLHNEGTSFGATWQTAYKSYIDTIRSKLPSASIILGTQNPRFETTSYFMQMNQRIAVTRAIAANEGYGLVDTAYAFNTDSRGITALLDADGVHPNEGVGATLNALVYERAFVASRM